jgi:hypothetical protein
VVELGVAQRVEIERVERVDGGVEMREHLAMLSNTRSHCNPFVQ